MMQNTLTKLGAFFLLPFTVAAVPLEYSFCALTKDGGVVGTGGIVKESKNAGEKISYKYDEKNVIAYSYEVCGTFDGVSKRLGASSVLLDGSASIGIGFVFDIEIPAGAPSSSAACTLEMDNTCDQVIDTVMSTTSRELAEGPSMAPSTSPSLFLPYDQEDILPCIAVIDEALILQTPDSISSLWDQYRAKYPDRPFCLLQPNSGTFFIKPHLFIPPAFESDGKTIYSAVNRQDTGNPDAVSDWYDICGLDALRKEGVTRVALFIDNSGSMVTADVQKSLDMFQGKLADNGFLSIVGEENINEDWITPCMTSTLLNDS